MFTLEMVMFISLLSTGCLFVSSAVVDPYGLDGIQDRNIGQIGGGQIGDQQFGIQGGVNQRPFGRDVIRDVFPGNQGIGQGGISGGRVDWNGKGQNRNGKNQGIRKGQGKQTNRGGRRNQGKQNNRDSRRGHGQLNNNRGSKGLGRRGGNRRNSDLLNKDIQINKQQGGVQL